MRNHYHKYKRYHRLTTSNRTCWHVNYIIAYYNIYPKYIPCWNIPCHVEFWASIHNLYCYSKLNCIFFSYHISRVCFYNLSLFNILNRVQYWFSTIIFLHSLILFCLRLLSTVCVCIIVTGTLTWVPLSVRHLFNR